jgi:hypothetical protein
MYHSSPHVQRVATKLCAALIYVVKMKHGSLFDLIPLDTYIEIKNVENSGRSFFFNILDGISS